jgi:hypothetical protein
MPKKDPHLSASDKKLGFVFGNVAGGGGCKDIVVLLFRPFISFFF